MRPILALLLPLVVAGCISFGPSVGDQLREACPIGTPLNQVLEALRQREPVRLHVMSPQECQKFFRKFRPEACAGGTRVQASFKTGLEHYLDVTYAFDSNEELAEATYEGRITGL